MHSNNVNVLIDKVVSVIQKLKEASATEIKRKISAFHQEAGGAEKLQKILTELISTGRITARTEKKGNGKLVESYCLANSNVNDSSNRHVDNGSNCNNPKINVKLEINFEGWDEIFAQLLSVLLSLVNTDRSSNEAEAFEVDTEDSNSCEVDDDTGNDDSNLCGHDDEVPYDEWWMYDHAFRPAFSGNNSLR